LHAERCRPHVARCRQRCTLHVAAGTGVSLKVKRRISTTWHASSTIATTRFLSACPAVSNVVGLQAAAWQHWQHATRHARHASCIAPTVAGTAPAPTPQNTRSYVLSSGWTNHKQLRTDITHARTHGRTDAHAHTFISSRRTGSACRAAAQPGVRTGGATARARPPGTRRSGRRRAAAAACAAGTSPAQKRAGGWNAVEAVRSRGLGLVALFRLFGVFVFARRALALRDVLTRLRWLLQRYSGYSPRR
jgi:hypothetical protein